MSKLSKEESLELMVYFSNQFAKSREEWMEAEEWSDMDSDPYNCESFSKMKDYARLSIGYCRQAGFNPDNILYVESACIRRYGA